MMIVLSHLFAQNAPIYGAGKKGSSGTGLKMAIIWTSLVIYFVSETVIPAWKKVKNACAGQLLPSQLTLRREARKQCCLYKGLLKMVL